MGIRHDTLLDERFDASETCSRLDTGARVVNERKRKGTTGGNVLTVNSCNVNGSAFA